MGGGADAPEGGRAAWLTHPARSPSRSPPGAGETRLFTFLRLLRQWEGSQEGVHLTIDVTTEVSYTTEELRTFLASIDPPLEVIVSQPICPAGAEAGPGRVCAMLGAAGARRDVLPGAPPGRGVYHAGRGDAVMHRMSNANCTVCGAEVLRPSG